ncbi:uncharacterized protein H6S33_009525 [Morchella sextelata]|uniref:uncharacterized protein n=1 Tax=Morchella sextelata TaxID=1174677 RepID=UPI001D04CEDA|nr:uncharacterized protein H6S33_009525 [Morchella sextelata]KAH0613145.1 hypothetical protein H6S33_009525 [Morchella sextelata]
MVSPLVLVVVLTVVTHVVNTLGAQQINNLLWSLYNSLPFSSSRADVANRKALQREILLLRAQLRATSSQDEFANWAKLSRALDKKVAEFEKLNTSISAARVAFDSKTRVVRWILTSGLRWFVLFWYNKEPMFWMPEGWVPGYVEWALSFPKAPIGSVSIQVWSFAVGQVVNLISGIIMHFFAVFSDKYGKTPVAMPAAAAGEKKKAKKAM